MKLSALLARRTARRILAVLCLLALPALAMHPLLLFAASGPFTPSLLRLGSQLSLNPDTQRLAPPPVEETPTAAFVNVVIEPALLPADGQTKAQVLVFVSDADGNPMPDGTPVSLSSTLGSLETTWCSTYEGLVKVTLTAPERPGEGDITALSGAATGNASFRAQAGRRAGQTTDAVPPAALDAAIQRAAHPLRPTAAGQWAHSSRHYAVQVDARGLQVSLPTSRGNAQQRDGNATPWALNLRLASVRVGDREIYRAGELTPQVRDNAAHYQHTPALSERYLALDHGMQQLFTLEAPPDAPGDLTLAVSLDSVLRPELLSSRDGVRFYPPGNAKTRDAVLAYSGALAYDADGKQTYADLSLDGHTLLMSLPEAWLAQAAYPVVIDPMIGSPVLVSDPRPQQADLAVAYNAGDDEYLVVWEHFITGGVDGDLRAQRFQADGTLLGDIISVTVASGEQLQPAVAYNTASGEYLVTWTDYRQDVGGDVYAQRIDADGTLLGSNYAIASTASTAEAPDVAYNPNDDVYLVVWGDAPAGTTYVAGQILSTTGALSGTQISIFDGDGSNHHPRVAYNPASDEFLVVWSLWWIDIYAQRLSGLGALLDNAGTAADESQSSSAFTITTASEHQYYPQVTAGTLDGSFLVAWQDYRNESKGDLYAQVVAAGGALSGSEIALSAVSGSTQSDVALSYDAAHQAYVAVWSDMRLNDNEDLYAQAISATGTLSGSAFCVYSATLSQIHPAVVGHPTNGENLVLWNEFGTASRNLYARRFDSGGTLLADAFPLQVPGDYKQAPAAAYNAAADTYLLLWEDLRHGSGAIYAQNLDLEGTPQGDNVPLTTQPVSATQQHPRVAAGDGADAGTGFLAVWEDQGLDADGDIYAQRFTAQGVLTGSAFALAATPERQTMPAVAYNETSETYLVVWRDQRADVYGDIYGRLLDAGGTISGSAFIISAYAGTSQSVPEVSSNPISGTFLVVWHQYVGSGNYDVYAQQVSGSGVLLDHPGTAADESATDVALALTSDSGYQRFPQVAVEPASGVALVVWDDRRSDAGYGTYGDIYGQRLSAAGALLGDNFAIGAANYIQRVPAVTVITGTGDFLATWDDIRIGSGMGALYGQRIASDGTLLGDNEPLSENGNWSLGLALATAPTLGQVLTVWEWGYEIYVQFYNVVGAVFSATPLSGSAPLQVSFSNASIPDGELTTFAWDFGDGATSSAVSPTHLYTQPGVYSVTLTASGPDGSHSLTRPAYISVTQAVTQDDTLVGHWPLDEESGTRYDTSGNSNHLTDTTTVEYATGVISRAADFESGDSDYLSIDDSVQQGLDITGSLTLVGWMWAESQSSDRTIAGKYAYGDVAERAYRLDLQSGGYLRLILSPDGAFDSSRDTLTSGTALAVQTWHHVAAVFDADTQVATLYCDGVACGTRTLSYDELYDAGAPFVLGGTINYGSLTRGFDGLLDAWSVYDRALSAGEIQALRQPTAYFSGTPLAGSAPLTVTFSNLSTGAITEYLWDFGDGMTGTLEAPTHVYTATGSYTVSLTVSGPGGSSDLVLSDYVSVTEAVADQPPQVDIGADYLTEEGTPLSFTGVITDSDTPTGHSILWDFGDGTQTTGTLTPTHTYGDNGLYTITLTVTDTTGLSATDILVAQVDNVAPVVTIQWWWAP